MVKAYEAKNLVLAPQNQYDTYKSNFNTQDIIDCIKAVDKFCSEKRTVKKLAKALQGKDDYATCRNIWDFIHYEIKYIADTSNEDVKSSNKTVYDAFADCKSMSILACDLLRELGISSKYRFTSYNGSSQITHVYVIVDTEKGDIIIDAVHHYFNEEVPYHTKKDVMSRELRFVHGLEDSTFSQLYRPSYIPFTQLSEGEMQLLLLRQQLEMYQAALPDVTSLQKKVSKGMDMIDNALYGGVHGTTGITAFTGMFDDFLNPIAKGIRQAQKMTKPASGNLIGRKGLNGGFKIAGIHIGVPSPKDDDDNLDDSYDDKPIDYDDGTDPNYECRTFDQWGYFKGYDQKCKERKELERFMNDNYAQTGYHFLYEFATSDDTAGYSAATTKRILHQAVIPEVNKFSKLDTSLLKTWARNGILELGTLEMESKKSTFNSSEMQYFSDNPFITPEEAIQRMIMAAQQDDKEAGVNFDPITWTFIILIVGSLLAALGKAKVFKSEALNRFSAQFGDQLLQTFGNVSYNPEKGDFSLGRGGNRNTGGTGGSGTGGSGTGGSGTGGSGTGGSGTGGSGTGGSPPTTNNNGGFFDNLSTTEIAIGAALLGGGVYLATKKD